MTLDEYLLSLITASERQVLAPKEGWFDLTAKVRMVDGKLQIADMEMIRGGNPTGKLSERVRKTKEEYFTLTQREF